MENYGLALKKLIKFTKSKSKYIAAYIGYDVSYISKWSHGSKLPSSRAIERINDDLGAYFAAAIMRQETFTDCCTAFSLETTPDELPSALSQYLSNAYRASLQQKQQPMAETKSAVRIITGQHNMAQFFADTIEPQLHSQTKPQEWLISSEFCTLYDANFWGFMDKAAPTAPVSIHVGLDMVRLQREPQYITYLYRILNAHLSWEFTFYNIEEMDDAHIIVVKDMFALHYGLMKGQSFLFCTYIDSLPAVQSLYEKVSLPKTTLHPLMAPLASPWNTGTSRTSFYTTRDFFFFLTNGIEYLLPSSVFQDIMAHGPAEKIFSIERLRITWAELLDKAHIDMVVPTSSLLRYIESGHIDLTEIQYTMSPAERLAHIDSALAIIKKNPAITIGLLDMTSNELDAGELNISFYSNMRTGFFKKNPLYTPEGLQPFYGILNDMLHQLMLRHFQQLKDSPQYYHYTEPELEEKYTQYKPLVEKLLAIHQ